MRNLNVSKIKELLHEADAQELAALEKTLEADARKGVIDALASARKRIAAEEDERDRLVSMYEFEQSLSDSVDAVIVGLDEVGRGPLAGPLAVGAVVLPRDMHIEGLNDSKKLKASVRERIAADIEERALAFSVVFVSPSDIDENGIIASLKFAFKKALDDIEESLGSVDLVLIDGNPLGIDKREIDIVKGDGKCASIAAASIIAKVKRDAYMDSISEDYPEYGFASNKGYGTQEHTDAIRLHGLSDVHRKSFCTSFLQETLF